MLDELSHMDRITQLQDGIEQLLTIMSRSLEYLHTRTNFKQVSAAIPITKARNPDKVHAPQLFAANRAELVTDLVRKAKQVDYLISVLPVPEPEEEQAGRLEQMEKEMQEANEEYRQAVARARKLTSQINTLLRMLLNDGGPLAPSAPVHDNGDQNAPI